MKKLFLTLLFIGAFITSVDAQSKPSENSFIKDKISINIGGGYQHLIAFYNAHAISGEALYGLNNWLEVGAVTTLNTGEVPIFCYPKHSGNRINIFNYGIKGKIHFLPLIVNPSFYRVDIYGNIEVGAQSVFFGKSLNLDNRTLFSFNAGGGIGFNFNKFFGIFYECNYSNINKLNHRYGFMFRF